MFSTYFNGIVVSFQIHLFPPLVTTQQKHTQRPQAICKQAGQKIVKLFIPLRHCLMSSAFSTFIKKQKNGARVYKAPAKLLMQMREKFRQGTRVLPNSPKRFHVFASRSVNRK